MAIPPATPPTIPPTIPLPIPLAIPPTTPLASARSRLFSLSFLLPLALAQLASIAFAASPIPDLQWHLPLIGQPLPLLSQTSPSLRFIRHANSSVRLSGRLPSLAITATSPNVLAAISPKDGSIVWRLVLPISDPIIQYALDLDHRHVALVTGHEGLTIRLLSLSDGRALWENTLIGDADRAVGIDELPNGIDVVFSSDQHSQHASFPDLIVASRGKRLLRLSGHEGVVRWTWAPAPLAGRIIRILPQTVPNHFEVLLWKQDSIGTFETEVQSLSSQAGQPLAPRPPSLHRCRQTSNPPLIVTTTSDDVSQPTTTTRPAVVCITNEGAISSALVPESPSAPVQLALFEEPKTTHPVLEDVGLAQRGVFLARLPDGAATVLRVAANGSLSSVWTFEQSDSGATYAGSIDRDGLPYVSKATFVSNLGLASLEILSLTPTEFTPEGMVVGQTFGYDLPENGIVVSIAVEVLKITNYVPMSRIMLVTELGAIQLWQGEVLQWERHEDLAAPASVTLHQSKSVSGSLLSGVPEDLPHYAVGIVKGIFASFLNLQPQEKTSLLKKASPSSSTMHIWLIGTTSGRLFAIVRDPDEEDCGKVVWKRNLLGVTITTTADGVADGISKGKQSVDWKEIVVEGAGGVGAGQVAKVVVTLAEEGVADKTVFEIGLMDGRILKTSTLTKQKKDVGASRRQEVGHGDRKLLVMHDQDLGGSPARFLGDRGALFKYLNPNLGVYQTSGVGGRPAVEVVDEHTGVVVWRFEFPVEVVPGSIMAALTENWLVLASRESGKGATLVRSVEWFMSDKADVRGSGARSNVTSCVREYQTVFDIKAAGFTKSRLGVTSRALLVVNDMDQIVSISRRLLDCRRPFKKPTAVEVEEQLSMYDPMILTDPKTIITGERATSGLKHVYSFPTEFESTSAVMGLGLDIFASSTAPSRTFDMLGPEFNKAQLVLTCVALMGATILLRPIVKKKQLEHQWYS